MADMTRKRWRTVGEGCDDARLRDSARTQMLILRWERFGPLRTDVIAGSLRSGLMITSSAPGEGVGRVTKPTHPRANGGGSGLPGITNGLGAYAWVTKPDGERTRKYDLWKDSRRGP